MKDWEMKWRYGVIRKTTKVNGKTYHHYDLHEIYKDKDGSLSWTEEPVSCNGVESIKELQIALTMQLRDSLEFPVMEIIKGKLVERKTNAEPFGGSGSTLIACEQLDRTCYMMEIDPKYCDVIRKRYAKFIGKETEWEQVSPKA